MTEQFHFFWSGPFSQWHKCKFTHGPTTYNCAEQFMMAQKAQLFKDEQALDLIMRSRDPREQKALGRQVKNYDDAYWRLNARKIVYVGNYRKFTQNSYLLEQLLATGDKTLVEASPYDTVWGIGLTENDPRALSRDTWQGTNWLGEVLTRLRNELKSNV